MADIEIGPGITIGSGITFGGSGGGGGGVPTFTYSNNTSNWYDRVSTISADGTKIYAISGPGAQSTIYQATLGSAWDASSVTNGTSGSFPLDFLKDKTVNIAFNADGTRLHTLIQDGGTYASYMPLGTAWDVSTLSGTFTQASSTLATSGRGLYYGDSGTKAYILSGSNNNTVYQWNLNSAYDLDSFSGSADASMNLGTMLSLAFDTFVGFAISADGTTGYCVTKSFVNVPNLYQFALSTPFDISTATAPALSTLDLTTAGFSSGAINGGSIMLKSDNTRMLISGQNSSTGKITQLNS